MLKGFRLAVQLKRICLQALGILPSIDSLLSGLTRRELLHYYHISALDTDVVTEISNASI